jgi:hypothetical protein
MRQVMPIAGGLAGGLALSSFGTISRGLNWGLSRGRDVVRLAATSTAAGALRAVRSQTPRTGEDL